MTEPTSFVVEAVTKVQNLDAGSMPKNLGVRPILISLPRVKWLERPIVEIDGPRKSPIVEEEYDELAG